MPRPTLRRAASTPTVRPRASSNPYPPTSPITTRSMSAAIASASFIPPSSLSSGVPFATTSTRSRRVNSTSATFSDSRRVLADITWCYDGQLSSSADPSSSAVVAQIIVADNMAPTTTDDATIADLERLTLVAGPGSIIAEEDEFLPEDDVDNPVYDEQEEILLPLRVGTPEPNELMHQHPLGLLSNPDSQPSSTDSSPRGGASRRSLAADGTSLGLGFALAFSSSISLRNRREASYSSISTNSDFEDIVPSPTYM